MIERESGLRKSTLSAFVVMVCTLISRFLGFIRIATITAIFGAGGKADIVNLPFSIPNNLRKLLAEGALSSAFIPVLSETLIKDNTGETAKKVVRNIFTLQLVIIIPLITLTILFAEPIIMHVLAEFRDPEQIALATRLFRYFINYLLLISVSAMLMGVLNSHNKFFIPAFTPVLFSLCVIGSTLLLHRRLSVFSMAVGVLVGGVAQLFFQIPTYSRLGYDVRFDFGFRNPHFLRIMKRWVPVLATSSLFTITQQVALRFASGLEAGSVTAISIAIVFFQLPFGIFSSSLTTVLFPRMSRQAASGDVDGLRESLQYGLRFLLVLLIPSAVFLALFGRPLISVALQRGAYSPESGIYTAKVLAAYALGLFGVGGFTFCQRLFYSMQRYGIPFFIALGVSILDVTLVLWLKETPLRAAGIALANSIAFTAGTVAFLVFARDRLGQIDGKRIAKTAAKVFVSVIPPAAGLVLLARVTAPVWEVKSTVWSFAILGAVALGFSGIVLVFYRFFRIEVLAVLRKNRPGDGERKIENDGV